MPDRSLVDVMLEDFVLALLHQNAFNEAKKNI